MIIFLIHSNFKGFSRPHPSNYMNCKTAKYYYMYFIDCNVNMRECKYEGMKSSMRPVLDSLGYPCIEITMVIQLIQISIYKELFKKSYIGLSTYHCSQRKDLFSKSAGCDFCHTRYRKHYTVSKSIRQDCQDTTNWLIWYTCARK